jgi:peroxiredoxin
MYPHERSLVEKMKGKPFALIGVNSDAKEKVQAAIARENITWRSFWDGGDTSGPIATQYGVRGWPTIYVLDHEGIIRYKNVRGPAMDKAVDELLDKVSTSNIIHANSETFAAHLESKKPLMLDFYAEW